MMNVEMINGVRNSFGTRETEVNTPAAVDSYGMFHQVVFELDAVRGLVSHIAGDETGAALFPTSLITRIVVLPATEAFAGTGTELQVKLVDVDGVAIDDVATVALADVNAGTVVDTPVAYSGDKVAYFVVEGDDEFTAGKAVMIVEYVSLDRLG